jgi:hypothetical protein
MTKKTDLLPGTLDMLILNTLTRAPQHGYGIALSIKHFSQDFLTVEEGSLYPALQRLLLQGWVKAEWKKTETHRRASVIPLLVSLQQASSCSETRPIYIPRWGKTLRNISGIGRRTRCMSWLDSIQARRSPRRKPS